MKNRSQGLAGALIPGAFPSVDSLPPGENPDNTGAFAFRVPRISLPAGAPDTGYGLVLSGFIRVPRAGIYSFFLSSDDGSRLTVAEETVVDHDGFHGMSEKEGQAALHRGWHPVEVRFFQGGGGAGLRLEVEGPGIPRREVPAQWLAHEKGGTISSTGSGP
jgi:hypothetical protein